MTIYEKEILAVDYQKLDYSILLYGLLVSKLNGISISHHDKGTKTGSNVCISSLKLHQHIGNHIHILFEALDSVDLRELE